jgi:hypothetical protein
MALHGSPFRSYFSSCSRDILLGCSPIGIAKTALKTVNSQFSADFDALEGSQTLKNGDFGLFLSI